MIFTETKIPAAFLVDVERRIDSRGYFGRIWCEAEFAAHGVAVRFAQANVAFTIERGTVRGLHYQHAPYEEAKLIRCTKGAIFDVIIDLRPSSPMFKSWMGIALAATEDRWLYVPEGCAHGYQTLEENCELLYLVSAPYTPRAEGGIRFDDPSFRINWPLAIRNVSEKDLSWLPFSGTGAVIGAPPAHEHREAQGL